MQRIEDLYPARSTPASAAYPDGSAKNESSDGADDGTPFAEDRDNDVFGMQQALLHQLGIVPSGLAETALLSQFLEGARRLASRAVYFVDSGAANAYVLTKATDLQANLVVFDGMEVEFKTANVNTGAATANIDGIGVVAITTPSGAALTGGEIRANQFTRCRYNLASTRLEIDIPTAGPGVTEAEINFNGTGVVGARSLFNFDPPIDLGTGHYQLDSPAITATSFIKLTVGDGANIRSITLASQGAGTCTVRTANTGGVLTDVTHVIVSVSNT